MSDSRVRVVFVSGPEMAPAARKMCIYPGCNTGVPDGQGNPTPYMTEEGIPTRAEVSQDLRDHVKMAHELPLKHKEAAAEQTKADADKLRAEAQVLHAGTLGTVASTGDQSRGSRPIMDKRAAFPRPEDDEGITESDWSFFTAQWERYKLSTSLSGEAEAQHLWVACSQALQRSLHNAGAGAIVEPVEVMLKINELAVKKRNNLVNVIELQWMGQQHGEKVSTFIARLNRKAEIWDYLEECQGCHQEV